jgi:hypothetical protein
MVVKPTVNLPVFIVFRFFLVRPGGTLIFDRADGRKTYSNFSMVFHFVYRSGMTGWYGHFLPYRWS